MSMSTHVVGVRDLDGTFAKMMGVKKSCDSAGIGYPVEVTDYFKHPSESEEYLRNEMESVDIKCATKRCGGEMEDGWEVDLLKLPDGVVAIRFVNSY